MLPTCRQPCGPLRWVWCRGVHVLVLHASSGEHSALLSTETSTPHAAQSSNPAKAILLPGLEHPLEHRTCRMHACMNVQRLLMKADERSRLMVPCVCCRGGVPRSQLHPREGRGGAGGLAEGAAAGGAGSRQPAAGASAPSTKALAMAGLFLCQLLLGGRAHGEELAATCSGH